MAAIREAPIANQSTGGGVRRRRAPWFDPRFAIGLLLIVASVLGVVGLVNAANASVDVLAARGTLTPGQRVHVSDLVPTSVRSDRTTRLYLRVSDVPAAGVVVTRSVSAGELVPQSAVGSAAGADLAAVVVSVDTTLAASVLPGTRIDLWSAVHGSADQEGDAETGATQSGSTGSYAPPTVLVSAAIVVRLIDQKQLVASTGSSLELLIPKADTASVLDAEANGAILSVVPVGLPLGN